MPILSILVEKLMVRKYIMPALFDIRSVYTATALGFIKSYIGSEVGNLYLC